MFELSLASGDLSMSVRRVVVEERISSLFAVSVWAFSPDPSLPLGALVGAPASLRITSGARFASRGVRSWTGIVSAAQQLQAEPAGLSGYQLRIVPALWKLTQRRNLRIFQHLSIPDIVDRLLAEWGITPAWSIDRLAYPALEYRLQYGESDHDFMSRLLEEAGIAFTFPDEDPSGARIHLGDALDQGSLRPAALPFIDEPSLVDEREYITTVQLAREVRPGALTLRDVDFRGPGVRLFAEAPRAPEPEDRLEQFHYQPGSFLAETGRGGHTPVADSRGFARHDPRHGQERAERALEALRADRRLVRFETNAMDLWPGVVFSIDGHPHADLSQGQALLVTRFTIEARANEEWRMSGEAVFTDVPYRPPLRTPKPTAHGVQSAIVVGPAGQEIHTDEFGRVRVQFPWDREGQGDEGSSCWIRCHQGWGGMGYGMQMIPRVGQEVLVSFLNGDPDQPVLAGRVYNAVSPVPYRLPEDRTVSTWKSESSPGGGGYNEIKLEDKKGDELVYVQAEKNLRQLVKNDETSTVLRHRDKRVALNETDTTGVNRIEVTGANRTEITGENRTTMIGGDRAQLVKRSRSDRTEGARALLVGKRQDIVIKGARRERVEDDSHLRVQGDARALIAGSRSLKVADDLEESVTGSHALATGKQLYLGSGEAMVGEATRDVTMKGPGGFIRIDAAGITIRGTLVRINEGGSPGRRRPPAPVPPVDPREPDIDEPTGPEPEPPPERRPDPPPAVRPPPQPSAQCEIERVEYSCEHAGSRKFTLRLPPPANTGTRIDVLEVIAAGAGEPDALRVRITTAGPRCAEHQDPGLVVRTPSGRTLTRSQADSTVDVSYGDIDLDDVFSLLSFRHRPIDYTFSPAACRGARPVAATVRVYPAFGVSIALAMGLMAEGRTATSLARGSQRGLSRDDVDPRSTEWTFEASARVRYGTRVYERANRWEDKLRRSVRFINLIKDVIERLRRLVARFFGVRIQAELPKLSLSYEGEYKEISESSRVGAEWAVLVKADPLLSLTFRLEILARMIAALRATPYAPVAIGLQRIREWAQRRKQVFEIYFAMRGSIAGEMGIRKEAPARRVTPHGAIEGRVMIEVAGRASLGAAAIVSVGGEASANTGVAARLTLDADAQGLRMRGTLLLAACKFRYAGYITGKFIWEVTASTGREDTFWEERNLLESPDVYVLRWDQLR